MVENVHDTPNKVLYLGYRKLLPWLLLTGSSDLWIQIGGGLYIPGSQYWGPMQLQDQYWGPLQSQDQYWGPLQL